jgi:predicted nucleic acid-binding protein
MNSRLFVDTWGWLTLHDKGEQRHQEVVDFYQSFRLQKGVIYTTDYVLDETFTLLFKRLNAHQAKRSLEMLVKAFQANKINLVFINEAIFTKTQVLRLKYIDKPYISFTDLSSMVVMQELNIQKVLTEDSHFLQVGMRFEKVP